MDNKSSRRALATYIALLDGETITQSKWLEIKARFEIAGKKTDSDSVKRSFQRDLTVIRETMREAGDSRQLVLKNGCYQLRSPEVKPDLGRLVAVAEIILASRAFSKPDADDLVEQLGQRLQPSLRAQYQQSLAMASRNYQSIVNARVVLTYINQIMDGITAHQLLTFQYAEETADQRRNYTTLPLTVFYRTNHFYTRMFDVGTRQIATFCVDCMMMMDVDHRLDDNPAAVQALDNQALAAEKVSVTNCNPITLEIETTMTLNQVRDQFPQARLVSRLEGPATQIEVVAGEERIQQWVASQGSRVRVLSPQWLVQQVRDEALALLEMYPAPAKK